MFVIKKKKIELKISAILKEKYIDYSNIQPNNVVRVGATHIVLHVE